MWCTAFISAFTCSTIYVARSCWLAAPSGVIVLIAGNTKLELAATQLMIFIKACSSWRPVFIAEPDAALLDSLPHPSSKFRATAAIAASLDLVPRCCTKLCTTGPIAAPLAVAALLDQSLR